MARKTERRDISGMPVTTQQFAPMRAFRLIALAGKTLGPTLGPLIPALAAGGVSSLLSLDVGTLMAGFAGLDVDAAERLLVEILCGTRVEVVQGGKTLAVDLTDKAAIDLVFDEAGLPALFAAVKFALEVNFGNFTGRGPALAPPAPAPTASP